MSVLNYARLTSSHARARCVLSVSSKRLRRWPGERKISNTVRPRLVVAFCYSRWLCWAGYQRIRRQSRPIMALLIRSIATVSLENWLECSTTPFVGGIYFSRHHRNCNCLTWPKVLGYITYVVTVIGVGTHNHHSRSKRCTIGVYSFSFLS